MKNILFKKRTAKITALMAAKAQTFYEKNMLFSIYHLF